GNVIVDNTAALAKTGAMGGSVFMSSGTAINAQLVSAESLDATAPSGEIVLVSSGALTATTNADIGMAGKFDHVTSAPSVLSGSTAVVITPGFLSSNYNPAGYTDINTTGSTLTVTAGITGHLIAPIVS